MATVLMTGVYSDGAPPSAGVDRDPRRTISMQKGTHLFLVLDVVNPQGTPIDIENTVPITFSLKKSPEPPLGLLPLPSIISRVGVIPRGAPRGRTSFTITSSDTIRLPPGDYVWDVKGKFPPGRWETLIGLSRFVVEPMVGVPDAPLTAVSPVTFFYAYPPLIADLDLFGSRVLEVGSSLVNPTFSVAYNRMPSAASMSDGTNTVALTSPFDLVTMPFTYVQTMIGAAQDFTLTANEPGGPTLTATVTVTWLPRVFYGSAVPGPYTEAFIESLQSSELLPSRVYSPGYAAGAGQKIYYAVPSAFGGSPGDFRDAATGFAVGISKVATAVSVTNAYGVTLPYDLWESDVAGLGALTLLVS